MRSSTSCWRSPTSDALRGTLLAIAAALSLSAIATDGERAVTLTGAIHSEVLIAREDSAIDAPKPEHPVLTNTYADLALGSRWVDAGARVEFLEYPLPGFEPDFKGWGVPCMWVKGKLGKVQVTLGSLYDQFGSGFIFRTYEQRSLGIDNAVMGARVAVNLDGIAIKALTGRQRHYWDWNKAWLTGADAEVDLDRWSTAMREHGAHLSVGASWVNKHEGQTDIMVDATHRLRFPSYVNAWDGRVRFQQGAVSVLAEAAGKTQDPSFDNGYTYRPGHVEMLSVSYSRSGLSALAQAKRSERMNMRSSRSVSGTSSMINHLPAFTLEHTYALPAMYPYATHSDGEWALQSELSYHFKRGTAIGGKHGMKVKACFSHIHSLRTTEQSPADTQQWGTDGPRTSYWRWGDETYYQDIDLQIERTLSRSVKVNLMYMHQRYNKDAIEGEGGMVRSHIVVGEARWKISRKTTLRAEAQYLATRDDRGDWIYGLAELSLAPHWMITLADAYNSGDTRQHYYQALLTFSTGSHRLQGGYARTRAGFNCSGGVCRYVPATRGFTLSYNFNF